MWPAQAVQMNMNDSLETNKRFIKLNSQVRTETFKFIFKSFSLVNHIKNYFCYINYIAKQQEIERNNQKLLKKLVEISAGKK